MSVEVLLTWQSKRSSGGLVGPGGGPVDTMEVRSDPVEVWFNIYKNPEFRYKISTRCKLNVLILNHVCDFSGEVEAFA